MQCKIIANEVFDSKAALRISSGGTLVERLNENAKTTTLPPMNKYVALCACGAEKILGNELKRLGCNIINRGGSAGRVLFEGGDDVLYKANIALRTSDRVFLCVADYKAGDFDSLFDGCRKAAWQDLFRKDVRVVVDKARCRKSVINSEHTVQSVVQKAIYTKLGEVWHMTNLPETGNECTVRVYLDNDEALVLLDTSGEPLHKRGYRTRGGIAPLRESVAAALLFELLWKRKLALHDPFCGSGTIALEALLYACNIPPGLARSFAYKNFAVYSAERENKIRKDLADTVQCDVVYDIVGTDVDPHAVKTAEENANKVCSLYGAALEKAGGRRHIGRPHFFASDFHALKAEADKGCILCNPPYGERLGDKEAAEDLYREMATLRDSFSGWAMGFLTSVRTFEECFGKKASTSKPLKAGNLDTTLYIYEQDSVSRRKS